MRSAPTKEIRERKLHLILFIEVVDELAKSRSRSFLLCVNMDEQSQSDLLLLLIRSLSRVVLVFVVRVGLGVRAYGEKTTRVNTGRAPFSVLAGVIGFGSAIWHDVKRVDRKMFIRASLCFDSAKRERLFFQLRSTPTWLEKRRTLGPVVAWSGSPPYRSFWPRYSREPRSSVCNSRQLPAGIGRFEREQTATREYHEITTSRSCRFAPFFSRITSSSRFYFLGFCDGRGPSSKLRVAAFLPPRIFGESGWKFAAHSTGIEGVSSRLPPPPDESEAAAKFTRAAWPSRG